MKRIYNGNQGMMDNYHIPVAEKALHVAPITVKAGPSRVWRKKWKCKKNKGEHTWVLGTGGMGVFAHSVSMGLRKDDGRWQTWRYFFDGKMWRHRHCSACGKQGVQYADHDKSRIDKVD